MRESVARLGRRVHLVALDLLLFLGSPAWAAGMVTSSTLPQMIKRVFGLILWGALFACPVVGFAAAAWGVYKMMSAGDDPRERKQGKKYLLGGIAMSILGIIFVAVAYYTTNKATITSRFFTPSEVAPDISPDNPANIFQ